MLAPSAFTIGLGVQNQIRLMHTFTIRLGQILKKVFSAHALSNSFLGSSVCSTCSSVIAVELILLVLSHVPSKFLVVPRVY